MFFGKVKSFYCNSSAGNSLLNNICQNLATISSSW
ncbi:MAG: hypothetical protein K1W36_03960 [Lachnospiraceae bacterium]